MIGEAMQFGFSCVGLVYRVMLMLPNIPMGKESAEKL